MKPSTQSRLLFLQFFGLFCLFWSFGLNACWAANWPGWRGADGMGVSPEKNFPTEWSSTQNVRWKVPLEGAGVSAPIVWDDFIFLTASDGRLNDHLHVYCFHRDDGRML